MKYKNKKKYDNHNSEYDSGFGYPAMHYDNDYGKEKNMPKVKGSFWTPCKNKSKNRQRSGRQSRHSFCDGY